MVVVFIIYYCHQIHSDFYGWVVLFGVFLLFFVVEYPLKLWLCLCRPDDPIWFKWSFRYCNKYHKPSAQHGGFQTSYQWWTELNSRDVPVAGGQGPGSESWSWTWSVCVVGSCVCSWCTREWTQLFVSRSIFLTDSVIRKEFPFSNSEHTFSQWELRSAPSAESSCSDLNLLLFVTCTQICSVCWWTLVSVPDAPQTGQQRHHHGLTVTKLSGHLSWEGAEKKHTWVVSSHSEYKAQSNGFQQQKRHLLLFIELKCLNQFHGQAADISRCEAKFLMQHSNIGAVGPFGVRGKFGLGSLGNSTWSKECSAENLLMFLILWKEFGNQTGSKTQSLAWRNLTDLNQSWRTLGWIQVEDGEHFWNIGRLSAFFLVLK